MLQSHCYHSLLNKIFSIKHWQNDENNIVHTSSRMMWSVTSMSFNKSDPRYACSCNDAYDWDALCTHLSPIHEVKRNEWVVTRNVENYEEVNFAISKYIYLLIGQFGLVEKKFAIRNYAPQTWWIYSNITSKHAIHNVEMGLKK